METGTFSTVIAGNALNQRTSSAADRTALTRKQFLQILIAEMMNQDPLSPMDNAQMLSQLTSMEQLSATQALSDNFAALLNAQAMGSAGALIGKEVSGLSNGIVISGTVQAVGFEGGNIKLNVNGFAIRIEDLIEIRPVAVADSDESENAADGEADGAGDVADVVDVVEEVAA